MAVTLEQIAYGGWQHCYRLSNGVIEIIIPGEIGIRLIRFGFVGGENEFCEVGSDMGHAGDPQWRFYGGHRLWHAPEHVERTYLPDNQPITIEQMGDRVRITQEIEARTGLQKQIDLVMDASTARVTVIHRMINHHLWATEFAPWALSVMMAGGTAIIPLPPRGKHPDELLPASTLTLWKFTDLADPRWKFGQRYILLRQDVNITVPQKMGASVPDGWMAYVRNGHLFVKQFDYQATANYPDMNSTVEVFTNDFMLELETLGARVALQPGEAVEHVEHWSLFDGVATPHNDQDVEQEILPLIER